MPTTLLHSCCVLGARAATVLNWSISAWNRWEIRPSTPGQSALGDGNLETVWLPDVRCQQYVLFTPEMKRAVADLADITNYDVLPDDWHLHAAFH